MKMVSLSEVVALDRKGVHPSEIAPETPYIGLEHIERGGRILPHPQAGDSHLKSLKFSFSAEHILYGKLRPNLGKISRPNFAGICSTDILPLRPNAELDRNYLAHYLSQPAMIRYATSRATGVNLPRLSPTSLAKFPIPLPSLDEQRRIAAILDQADAIRAKHQQALVRLSKAVGTTVEPVIATSSARVVPLSDLAQVASGITKGRKTNADTREINYLAVANVQAGRLELGNVKSIKATAAEIEKFKLIDGDILLTEGGDPDKLGRGTIWREELSECIHQNHIFRARVNDAQEIRPLYLNYFLRSQPARSYFLRSAKQTTGIASINKTQLNALPVVLPPISIQDELITKIEAIEGMLDLLIHTLDRDNELFASLQARAFKGEL